MYLQTLVILLSIGNTFCDFLPVSDGCKYWNYLKVYGNGDLKKLHCILDQDFQSGLVYTEWKMIPKGTCPIYNRFARQIDIIPCNRSIGMCPNKIFPSYSGVTFTGCYYAIRKQTNVMRPTVPPAVSDNSSNCPVVLAVIATLLACIICMFLTACVWYFVCRSKIKLSRENVIPREQGQRRVLTTMRGNEYLVTNASPLVADNYERFKIIKDDLVAYHGSKPNDAKVQKVPCSRRTSDAYSGISTDDWNASEDHLVDTESEIEQ